MLQKRPALLGPLAPVEQAWRLLERIEERSPDDLSAVLLHPQVGVWFSHALRRIDHLTTDEVPVWVTAGHLYAVILAAAVRSHTDMSLQVPARRGVVALPTLGLARLGPPEGYRVVDAETRDGQVTLHAGGHALALERFDEPAPHWWNLRRLALPSSARTLNLVLDDIDPYRDLAEPVEPRRLDESSVAVWRDRLAAAWHIINRSLPGSADAMADAFWSITPLTADSQWVVRSASTGDGFGAALMSLPADAATAAVTLVHEFQHNKLGAAAPDRSDDGRGPAALLLCALAP